MALLLAACTWSCSGAGTGDDGGGAGGSGGAGGGGLTGSCEAPLDFDALSRYHGAIPYAGASLADGEARVSGSCGGEGPEQVFRWTAPRDGQVGFRLSSPDPSFTIHVRDRCADEETERLCAAGDQLLVLDVKKDEALDVIVDSSRGSEASFELGMIFQAGQLEEGEVCRPDASTGPCAEGLVCDQKEGRCQVAPEPVRPVLHRAQAVVEDERATFRVEGSAPNRNVYALELRFFDDANEPLLIRGTEALAADISKDAYGKEAFEAEAWTHAEEILGASTVKLWLLDAKFVASNIVEVPIEWPDPEETAPEETAGEP